MIEPFLSDEGHGSEALCWTLADFVSFLISYTVGLLRRGISPSQGRYLHKHRINADKHPCFEWDSNPQSQYSSERKQFMT
jgi:hypothetical protein